MMHHDRHAARPLHAPALTACTARPRGCGARGAFRTHTRAPVLRGALLVWPCAALVGVTVACGVTAQSAMAAARQAPAAAAAQQAEVAQQADAGTTSNAVYPVEGKSADVARVLMEALRGTVIATPMGGSVVVSGDQRALAQAHELVYRLNQVAAQEQARNRDESERMRAADARARELQAANQAGTSWRVIDVTLGPTLGDSLSAISKAASSDGNPDLNIVFAGSESLALHPVRPVNLKRVQMDVALDTLAALASDDDPGSISISLKKGSGNPYAGTPNGMPVIMVERREPRGARTKSLEPIVGVFRLQGISGLDSDEDRNAVAREHAINMDAIEAGLEVIGRSGSFQMKLHPETGILFVKGTPGEIRLVADVLDMPVPAHAAGTAPPAPPTAPTPPTPPAVPTRPAPPAAPSEPTAPAPPAPPHAPAPRTPAAR